MKNIVIYVCIICITLLAAIVTGENFVVFLLGFELVLPVFLIILLHYLSKNIKINLKTPATAVKKNRFDVSIVLENTGKLPISCLEMTIVCQDTFDNTEIKEVVSGVIDGKSIAVISLGMEAEFAGKINFRLVKAKLFDYFHVCSREVCGDKSWNQTVVVPDVYEISFHKNFDATKMLQDGDAHSSNQKGDDISEVYNIRPFAPGDALHKIHWKLSVKTDDLLIKEFSDSLGKVIHIFVDYSQKDQEDWTHERFDEMAGILASISNQLLLENEVHQIYWYDGKEKIPHHVTIEKNEDIYETIGELTAMKPYEEDIDFQSIIDEYSEYRQQSKAYVLSIWNRMEKPNENTAK